MRIKKLLPFAFFMFGLIMLWAQVQPEGKTITSIKIEIIGPNTIGNSFVRQNLQIEIGGKYEGTAIDRSIRNLTSSGSVDDVRVFLDPDLSNQQEVALIFKVWTKPRIKSVIFEGNKKLSDRSLEKVVSLSEGDLLDEANLKEDLNLIQEKYLEKGYWNSMVDSRVIKEKNKDEVSILYKITEGDKRSISKILFKGNESISSGELLDEMETAPWRFWRFWSKRSRYRPEILEEDLEKLRETYRNQGFLDVSIEQSGVLVDQVGKSKIELSININEGKRSYFGKQTIVGNVSISTEDLLKLKRHEDGIVTGDPYSPALLGEETNRLRKRFGEKGYLDARVRVIRTPNISTNQIDLAFQISENNKFTVNSIQVRGNDKTKSIAIIRELALSPGDTFDKISSVPEHLCHICNIAYIPSGNIFIESGSIIKGIVHIRDRRNIPVADMPVGGIRFRLVIKPEVDCGLEVGVVQCHKFSPVIRPVRIGRERLVDFAFIVVGEV